MSVKLLVSFFLCGVLANAQPTFQKTYGFTGANDGLYAIETTTDGGFIMTGRMGYASNFSNSGRMWLIKTDANGDTLWTKMFATAGGNYGYSVQQTQEGGYIVAGLSYEYGAGRDDFYLVKTDGGGNIQWSKTYGGTGYDDGIFARQTSDGGYIFVGTTESFGAGPNDIYLVKTDSNGNAQWTKTYGSTSYDNGGSVIQTVDGGYAIAGTSSFGAGNSDGYVIKTDAFGNMLWSKTYGGTAYDGFGSIMQNANGEFIVSGSTASFGSGGGDVYCIKTDSDGSPIWSKAFGTSTGDSGYARQMSDGSFVIIGSHSPGSTSSDAYLIKADSDGNVLWSKSYGGSYGENFSSGKQTQDGGIILCGSTFTYSNGVGYKGYVVKTDLNGISGCNENSLNTIATIASTTVTTPSTQISSGGIVGNPPPAKSPLKQTVVTLCASFAAGTSCISPTCFGQCDGAATANPISGTPPYTFLWSTTATAQTITGLCAGAYSVTITDATPNTASAIFTLTQPGILNNSFSVNNVSSCAASDGSIGANISGGTAPYTYSCNPTGQTTSAATGLAQGGYTLNVTDANGCTKSGTAVVQCLTSIENYDLKAQISISPNPSSGLFTIQSPSKISSIEIMNVLGEKVFTPALKGVGSSSLEGGMLTIDLFEAGPKEFIFIKQ